MPIDVASGNVSLEYQDAVVHGRIDMVWDRAYSGHLNSSDGGMFGAGWTSRYASRLTRRPDGFAFLTAKGAVEVVDGGVDVVDGRGRLRKYGGFFEIFKRNSDYVVQQWSVDTEEVWRYVFGGGDVGGWMPLVAIEDPTGVGGLDLIRDGGRLIQIKQRLERRSIRLEYLPNQLLGSVYLTDHTGKQHVLARYEYDEANRLCASIDGAGAADRYEYDADGRLARELARDGGVFTYRYDTKGRCVLRRGLDGYDTKRLSYVDAARTTNVTDSYGATRTYHYLPSGQVCTAGRCAWRCSKDYI